MLSFFVHPTTAELDNFVLLQHVASGVFAVVLTVVGMASTVLLHMLNVMLVAVVVRGLAVGDEWYLVHT